MTDKGDQVVWCSRHNGGGAGHRPRGEDGVREANGMDTLGKKWKQRDPERKQSTERRHDRRKWLFIESGEENRSNISDMTDEERRLGRRQGVEWQVWQRRDRRHWDGRLQTTDMQMRDCIYGQNEDLRDEHDGSEAESAVLGVMIWQYKWCNVQTMKETQRKGWK